METTVPSTDNSKNPDTATLVPNTTPTSLPLLPPSPTSSSVVPSATVPNLSLVSSSSSSSPSSSSSVPNTNTTGNSTNFSSSSSTTTVASSTASSSSTAENTIQPSLLTKVQNELTAAKDEIKQLKTETTKLQSELVRIKADEKLAKTDNETLRTKLNNEETKREQAETSLKSVSNELTTITKKLTSTQQALDDTIEEKNARVTESNLLQGLLNKQKLTAEQKDTETTTTLTNLNGTIHDLTKKVSSLTNEITVQRTTLTTTETELQETKVANTQLRDSLNDETNKHTVTKTNLEKSKEEIILLTRKFSASTESYQKLDEIYRQTESARSSLAITVHDRDTTISNLQKELEALKVLQQSTQKSLEDTTKELSTTKSILHTTETNLTSTTEQYNTTSNALSNTRTELNDTHTRLQETLNTLMTTENELEKVHQDFAETKGNLSVTQMQLSSTEHKLHTNENTLQTTENKLHATTDTLNNTTEVLNTTKQSLAVTEEILATLKQQLTITEAELLETTGNLVQVQNTLTTTTDELESTRKLYEELKQTLQQVQQEKDDMSKKFRTEMEISINLLHIFRKTIPHLRKISDSSEHTQDALMKLYGIVHPDEDIALISQNFVAESPEAAHAAAEMAVARFFDEEANYSQLIYSAVIALGTFLRHSTTVIDFVPALEEGLKMMESVHVEYDIHSSSSTRIDALLPHESTENTNINDDNVLPVPTFDTTSPVVLVVPLQLEPLAHLLTSQALVLAKERAVKLTTAAELRPDSLVHSIHHKRYILARMRSKLLDTANVSLVTNGAGSSLNASSSSISNGAARIALSVGDGLRLVLEVLDGLLRDMGLLLPEQEIILEDLGLSNAVSPLLVTANVTATTPSNVIITNNDASLSSASTLHSSTVGTASVTSPPLSSSSSSVKKAISGSSTNDNSYASFQRNRTLHALATQSPRQPGTHAYYASRSSPYSKTSNSVSTLTASVLNNGTPNARRFCGAPNCLREHRHGYDSTTFATSLKQAPEGIKPPIMTQRLHEAAMGFSPSAWSNVVQSAVNNSFKFGNSNPGNDTVMNSNRINSNHHHHSNSSRYSNEPSVSPSNTRNGIASLASPQSFLSGSNNPGTTVLFTAELTEADLAQPSLDHLSS